MVQTCIDYDLIQWVDDKKLRDLGYKIFSKMVSEEDVEYFKTIGADLSDLGLWATDATREQIKEVVRSEAYQSNPSLDGLFDALNSFPDIEILFKKTDLENGDLVIRWCLVDTDGNFVLKSDSKESINK